MEKNLTLELNCSPKLAVIIVVVHIFAISCCLCIGIAWPWRLILALVPLVNMLLLLPKYAWRSDPKAIVAINQSGDSWQLQTKQGETMVGKLLGDSLITTPLMILNFQVPKKLNIINVMITKDATSPQKLRRLRMQLLTTKGLTQ